MPGTLKCPKCNGLMEEGWLPDWSRGGIRCLEWTPGQPQPALMGIYKTSAERAFIVAYCCSACGFLEMYAKRTASEDVDIY